METQLNPTKTQGLRNILLIVTIIILALIGYYIYTQIQRQKEQTAEIDKKARIRNNITNYVTAERSDYMYSVLGGIHNLKITVTNGTEYVVDNAKVKVTYIKANGGVWDTKIVDFNLIPAFNKQTVQVPDTDRGVRVTYEIVSVKSNALGLY
jgi:type II secretory pathway pseudopilin PulG